MNYSVVVVPPQVPISWPDIAQKNPTMAQAMVNNVSSRCSGNKPEVKNTSLFGCNYCKGYFSKDHLLREHLTRCQFQNSGKLKIIMLFYVVLIGIQFTLFSKYMSRMDLGCYPVVCLSDLPSTFCGICKQIFRGIENLQKHLQTHFVMDNKVKISRAASNVASVTRQIVTNAKLTNNNQSYECKFCGRTFQKGSAMKMHIDKVHMTDVKKEVKDIPFHSKRGEKTNIIHVVTFFLSQF